jgi:hypothetical protein
MTRRITGTVLAIPIFFLTAHHTPLWGQAVASAQISGQIADPSGAAVPRAKVTAIQTETKLVRTTVSGQDGSYVLPNLPVGPYRLEMQAAGFQTYLQTGIQLQVSDNPTINVSLQVGDVTRQVEVSAGAIMVQTQSTSLSQIIDQRSVVDLPLNGRNALQLVMLAGSASDRGPALTQSNDLTGSKIWPSSNALAVAGGQPDGTNYLMDGGDNNDSFSNVNLPFPFPDALQEFSVQTNSLSARYGLHPGAVVNVLTKSGTNEWHGDVFEFIRNGDLNARNFFGATHDLLKRNQFGGTIGGPIRKDKLFGFFGYQGTRIRTVNSPSTAFVPTQAVLNGDWSAMESGACQSNGKPRTITNPATGAAYANDFVDPHTYNQQALNLLKILPLSSNPCGNQVFQAPAPSTEDQYIGRVDWIVNSKHSFFGRIFMANYQAPPQFGGNALFTTNTGLNDRNTSIVLGDTYTISPTILNSAHVTFSRIAITRGPASDFVSGTGLGINMYSYFPNELVLSVSGKFSVGCSTCSPSWFDSNSGQIADDVDIVHGHHHIAFGADVIRNQLNNQSGHLGDGIITINGQFTNDALLDYMLGLTSQFRQGAPDAGDERQLYIGAYASDNFQVTKRLNLQVGLRWEPYMPMRERHRIGATWFSPAAYLAGTVSKVFANAPPGVFYAGDPGYPKDAFSFAKLATFEPRVGFALDPTGNGRQTIRAGYGVFYHTPMTFYYTDAGENPPWASAISITSPPGGLTNPYQGFAGGNPYPTGRPSSNAPFVPGGAYIAFPSQGLPTNMQQWDFSYQNQLAANWVISITYVGNKTTHIWTGTAGNPAVYIPGQCGGSPCSTTGNTAQRRLLSLENPVAGAAISTLALADDGSNGEYHGLVLSAQHRFSNHYTLLTNYTWSHCIDEGDFGGDINGPQYQNPYNRNADRGNCGFDIRHNFNLSFVAAAPKFAGSWTNRLLGHWQLAPIFSVRSGPWYSVSSGLDNSLTAVGLDRPNVVPGVDPYVKNMNTRQWLTPSAFTPNLPGQYGNLGQASLVGPGYFEIDAALSRNFTIPRHEAQRLEVRFETFNVLNHTNFNTPTTSLTSSTFGTILSARDPRILQFAMKYVF